MSSSDYDLPDLPELTPEQEQKLNRAQEILNYRFVHPALLLAAITHPSATEGKNSRFSYERLEFLGDSILGSIVAVEAFKSFSDIDEGGLTRIKVSLVSGSSLSAVAESLGFEDIIVFGSSEVGTGKRGLTSALENVYEAIVAALFLDGTMGAARTFVKRTLIPFMNPEMAKVPENPKSVLQEKLQVDGITPTYKLIDMQGPPHDRTFVAQVFAGEVGMARGTGKTKKEAESQAAKSTLARLGDFLSQLPGISQLNLNKESKKRKKQKQQNTSYHRDQTDEGERPALPAHERALPAPSEEESSEKEHFGNAPSQSGSDTSAHDGAATDAAGDIVSELANGQTDTSAGKQTDTAPEKQRECADVKNAPEMIDDTPLDDALDASGK